MRLEDQRVELVGEVVVVADRAPVAQLAVQPALIRACEAGGAGGRPSAPSPAAVRTRATSARPATAGRPTAALRGHGERVGEGGVEVRRRTSSSPVT